MRKNGRLWALLTLSLAAWPAAASGDIGVIGGVNLGQLRVEPDGGFEFSNRTGIAIGGVLSRSFGDAVAVQIEPMYVQAGARAELASNDGPITIELDYIDLPVMLKVAIAAGRSLTPYIMAGPSLGYLLSAKEKASFIPGEQEDIEDQLKQWDVGIGVGGGVSLPMGQGTMFLEGRYTFGLSSIDDDDLPDDQTESIKNRGYQILVGVTFGLGGDR